MNFSLKDRPTLQKALAALLASAIAVVGMLVFGGDEQKDRDVLDNLCRFGLNEIAIEGGVDLCVKDPDPLGDLDVPAAPVKRLYPQTGLCPGDGTSGSRIRIYVGAPADREPVTDAQIRAVRIQLGYAERSLHESDDTYYQKLNFYCATDTTPTIERVVFPAIGSDNRFTFDDFITGITAQIGTPQPNTIYHAFVFGHGNAYPYGGQGTVMSEDSPAPVDQLDDPQFSMTAAGWGGNYGDVLLHELGHNMGAVQPSANHSTGDGWHCTDNPETMCYDDGGSGIGPGNPMHRQCDLVAWKEYRLQPFDCDDDFWAVGPNIPASFDSRWNVADSKFLTPPRRK